MVMAAENDAGRVIVTLGPSLPLDRAAAILPDAEFRPPIAAGDAPTWDLAGDDILVIIDGHFLQSRAVRHKELLELLDKGVIVIGASSMGALRAAELHQFGMVGIGSVFKDFASATIEGDDEVALVHSTREYRYAALGWTMVDLRDALDQALTAGAVDENAARIILSTAKALPFTRRDSATIIAAAKDNGADEPMLRSFRTFCPDPSGWVKSRDAEQALRVAARFRQDRRARKAAGRRTDGALTYCGVRVKYARTSYSAAWQTMRCEGAFASAYDVFLRAAITIPGFPDVYTRLSVECLLLESLGRGADGDVDGSRAWLRGQFGVTPLPDGLLPLRPAAELLGARLARFGLPTRLADADPGLLELLREPERHAPGALPAVLLASRLWRADPQYDWITPAVPRLRAAGFGDAAGQSPWLDVSAGTLDVRECVGRLLRSWGVRDRHDVLPSLRERGLIDLPELVRAIRCGVLDPGPLG